MSIYKEIQDSMQQALKVGKKAEVRTLRTLMAKVKEKAIAKGGELTRAEELKVLQAAARHRQEAIDLYAKGGRQELVEAETEELAIIESYLPEPLSREDLVALIDTTIRQTGAASLKDMGKVMSGIMRQVAGRADGREIQALVRGRLENLDHPLPPEPEAESKE
ncbi:MAG: GatB/YqeY domain-containing protein [Fidelibacterota bacterium]